MTQLFLFTELYQPWFLLLLIPVGLLLAAELAARPPGVITISTGETLAAVRQMRGLTLRRLPAALRAIALCLFVFALARPVANVHADIESADVIDIMLVVDVSGSMTQEDFIVDRSLHDRLYVTKLAVLDFVESRKQQVGMLGTDRVGLVLYAKYAWVQCPLTLDYGILTRELARVTIDKNDEKFSRTAIGSALGLAVSKLIKSEADSKVIILMTDGLNNEGNLDPVTAAQLARDYGIRVYTIGAGATESMGTGFGSLLGSVGVRNNPIDEEAMRRISEITGGKYYRATDAESLQEAYHEIDQLERTEIEVGETFKFDDVFAPYAVLGALMMGASVFGRRRWFEPIP